MTGKRSISRGVVYALGGLPLFITAPLCRHWHLRLGATDDEVRGLMPGDDAVPKASFNATRAITIDSPPAVVWPWIVQMGYRRAGFYTYALLDNAGYESAEGVLKEYQHPQIGDWMPMASKVSETTAFRVRGFATKRVASVGEARQHVGMEAHRLARRRHSPDNTPEAAVPVGVPGDGALHSRAP